MAGEEEFGREKTSAGPVTNFTDIRLPPRHALPTKACAACGGKPVAALVGIPRTMPTALLFGVALALPLLLALAIGAVWGSRDHFDIMAGTGGRDPNELRFLRALPVVVPVLWSVAAIIGIEAFDAGYTMAASIRSAAYNHASPMQEHP